MTKTILIRDDGEIFSQNSDGTYSMDKQREDMPTTFYRYKKEHSMDKQREDMPTTFYRYKKEQLMQTGIFTEEKLV